MGAVFSVTKHFKHMLLDRTFTIITNHLSLVHAFKKSTTFHTPRQSRQLSYLTEFDCTFECIAGLQNSTADCLFRLVVHSIFLQEKLSLSFKTFWKNNNAASAQTQHFKIPAWFLITASIGWCPKRARYLSRVDWRFSKYLANCNLAEVQKFYHRSLPLLKSFSCKSHSTTCWIKICF